LIAIAYQLKRVFQLGLAIDKSPAQPKTLKKSKRVLLPVVPPPVNALLDPPKLGLQTPAFSGECVPNENFKQLFAQGQEAPSLAVPPCPVFAAHRIGAGIGRDRRICHLRAVTMTAAGILATAAAISRNIMIIKTNNRSSISAD
jgi:hypothetical protein